MNGRQQNWSAAVTCSRDCSPHTVVFQCASMHAAALRGYIHISVQSAATANADPPPTFLYRLRVTDTSILFTKNFGLLTHGGESSDGGGGGIDADDGGRVRGLTSPRGLVSSASQVRLRSTISTSSESPATATGGLSARRGTAAIPAPLHLQTSGGGVAPPSGTTVLSEVVFATTRREAAPRLALGKIRVQVMQLRSASDAAIAQRCLAAKDWQTLNRCFAAAEVANAVQTFNLSCDVDPVVGAVASPFARNVVSLSQVKDGAGLGGSTVSGGGGGLDSSMNTPRSAASSSGPPLQAAGLAALMFGAGALVGATAALVFGRLAKNGAK